MHILMYQDQYNLFWCYVSLVTSDLYFKMFTFVSGFNCWGSWCSPLFCSFFCSMFYVWQFRSLYVHSVSLRSFDDWIYYGSLFIVIVFVLFCLVFVFAFSGRHFISGLFGISSELKTIFRA